MMNIKKSLKQRIKQLKASVFLSKLVFASLIIAASQSAHANEEFFIPLPEDHTLNFLNGISSNASCNGNLGTTGPVDQMFTVTDFVVRVDNTVIVIDHYENDNSANPAFQYEADIAAIAQAGVDRLNGIPTPNPATNASTRIYGDGTLANGAAPGVTTDAGDVLLQGQVIVFEERIETATQLGDVEVTGAPTSATNAGAPAGTRTRDGLDGGDRVFATETINLTRSQWSGVRTVVPGSGDIFGPGTLFAGAFELFPISQWGNSFTLPAGEDNAIGPNPRIEFQWTGVTVMAANDGTIVSIDANGDGDYVDVDAGDINAQTINRGETIEVRGRNDIGGQTTGGLRQGARIFSSDVVQSNIITGQECSTFASRWFTLFPDALLGNNYYEPVSTPVGTETVIILYNPSPAELTINFETTAGLQTPIVVPAFSSVNQVIPDDSGARFFTGSNATFGAFTVVDESATTHDWGHASTAQRLMGNVIQVGFAQGDDPSSDLDYANNGENAAPVWIIGDNVVDTTDTQFEICVDVSGDGGSNTDPFTGRTYDYTFTLDRLDSARLFDGGRDTPNAVPGHIDSDQSGMLAFVCDGSDAILAAAWGQDPNLASPGLPALDTGTTVRSVSADVAFMGDTVFEDVNNNGVRDPSEPGIQNVTVILTPEPGVNLGNGPGQAVTTATDFNGSYLFTGLVNGDYHVEVIAPSGFVQTFDPDATNGDPVVLDNQSSPTIENASGRLDQDFGYQNNVPQGQVGDFIYSDTNGNGIQEPGEAGIPGINVELCLANSTPIAGDQFSAVSYANNPTQWTSNWIETGDNNNPASGDIRITGGELLLDDDNNNNAALTRQFNSIGTNSVTISYDFRAIAGGYEATDIISVQTSINNGPFVTQDTLLGLVINNTSGSRSFSVTTGFATNVRLRFEIQQYRGGDEAVFIDDVAVSADPSCQTQTTDGNGLYLFNNRLPGFYEVTVLNPPAGLENTDDPGGNSDNVNTFTLYANGGNLEQDFGYFTPATVIGHVYIDTNGNGVQEPGEPNIEGLNIEVTDANGDLSVVTTDANGDYTASVPPGSTQIGIDTNDPLVIIAGFPNGPFPASFIQTDGVDPSIVTAVAGATVDAGDDGYFQGNVIGDTVYSEEDGTPGVQGAGDPGIPNVLVTLTPPPTIDLGAGLGVAISQFTDTNGNYSFSGLPDGTYTVAVSQPSGTVQTEDPDGGADNMSAVTIAGGVTNNEQDFGYSNNVPQGFIGDRIYSDLNGNGTQDVGEPGLGGIIVEICGDLDDNNATANTCRTETTDADGDYLFGDLFLADGTTASAGDTAIPATDGSEVYTVTVINPPAGQTNSQDPDNGLPNFSQLTLSTAGGNLDQDFGYFQPGTVTGHLYIDTNGDGTQQLGEPDLVGVDVVITDSNGDIQIVATDSNGDYSALVPVGTVTANVDETDPQFPLNHLQTEGADPTTVTLLTPGGTVDAGIDGYAPAGSIGDLIFFDSSIGGTTGIYDLGIDIGAPNVLITLTPPAGIDVGNGNGGSITTLTDANGNYSFGSLQPGTYTIDVAPPSGVNQTVDPGEPGVQCVTCETTSVVTLVAGETNNLQDFGFQSIAPPGVCPIGGVDFDEYTLATANSTTIINSEYATGGADNTNSPLLANRGFTVTATGGTTDAVFYNSSPTTNGNDPDLEVSNSGNVLIVQETGNLGGVGEGGYIPDDQQGGGSLFFDFETPLTEFSLTITDFETTNSSLVFTDTSTGVSVTVTNNNLINTGPGSTPEFLQNPANCAAVPVDEAICVMDNTITAAELSAFAGVAMFRFDRVEKRFTGSGGVDDLAFTYDCNYGTIGDKIFTDNNANGLFDVGDTGLAGINVQICGDLDDNDATAQTCRVETTDSNGNYLFGNGLAADGVTVNADDIGLAATNGTEDYTITVLNPPVGSINIADPDGSTPNVSQLTLPGAFSNLDQDFGYVIRSSISGTVWLDEDLDGILDIEETGITQVQVELVRDGVVIATTVSDANGKYAFPNVIPGNYTVNIVDPTIPAGLQNTAGAKGVDPRPINVPPGTKVNDVDFGYIPNNNTGAIGDRVWFDADQDGIQDPGEAGIEGVSLNLLNAAGATIATTTTNANGDYLFTDVPFGRDYTVSIPTNDPNLVGTTPTVGPQSEGGFVGNPVDLTATSSVITDIDFGFQSPNSNTIIDSFWVDSDRDGLRDVDEQPIANVTVTLFNDANNDGIADDADSDGQPDVVATTTSDANGGVSFTGLADGSYVIAVTDINNQLNNYVGTTGEAAVGLSDTVAVAGGVIDSQESFGYNQPGLIAGTVYNDVNNNSDQDAGEAGFSGTTVTLLIDALNDGNYVVVESVLTSPNGSYEFNVNLAGDFRVVVTPPGGTQTEDPDATVNDQTDITLILGQSSVGNDFGYTNVLDTFTMQGTVFIDPNKNGVEDAGDPGIEGVTVDLIDRNDVRGYDVVNGMLDINDDGRITVADDGLVNGIAIIDGMFDIDDNGTIDQADNGVVGLFNILEGMVNIAQAGIANQSSTGFEGDPNPNVAIDGNPVGGTPVVSVGPFIHTLGSIDTDYWEVDLGSVSAISQIKVFNRDGNSARLENVRLLVSDTPFPSDPVDFAGAVANADFVYQILGSDLNDPEIALGGIAGRYVRLQKSGTDNVSNFLHFAELKVTPSLIRASSDAVVASTRTDALGNYTFAGLGNGDYSVAVTDEDVVLAGFDITSGSDVLDRTINNANEFNVDFGYIRDEATGSIAGEVFIDENASGIADDPEFNLSNVDVYLCSGPIAPAADAPCDPTDDEFLAQTKTDAKGEYSFKGLESGRYVVGTNPVSPNGGPATDIPEGLVLTAIPPLVNLSEGQNVNDVDVGYQSDTERGVLSGFVWADTNNNGVYDSNEAPIGGVRIYVRRAEEITALNPNGDILDDNGVIRIFTTAADGSWIASNIDLSGPTLVDDFLVEYESADIDINAGANLVENQPTNLPNGDVEYFNLDLDSDPDNNISFLDFGFGLPIGSALGSISGTIYEDLNQNDNYELGQDDEIQRVTINLVNSAGDVVATTITGRDGSYAFDGLKDGVYTVVISDNNNILSDLNEAEMLPANVTILAANSVNNVNAGFVTDLDLGSIGNRFFFDTNGNGIREPGEAGIAGITVQCWLDTDQSEAPESAGTPSSAVTPEPGIDNLLRTVTTDENGEYYCTSLPAGQYIVVVADANGYDEASDGTFVTGNVGNNFAKNWSYALTLAAGTSNTTADFGVSGNNQISGTIFVEDEDLTEPNGAGIGAGELDGVAGGPSPDTSTLVSDPQVELVPVDLLIEQEDGSFVVLDTVLTNDDGSYSFTGLPDGRYQVRVRPTGTGIDGYGQTGDPDLAAIATTPSDLVCDSPTAALCDNLADDPIDLDSNSTDPNEVAVTGIDFGYQRDFTTTPVTMSFFNATRNGDVVEFVWETSNEVGHAGFQIYARTDSDWVLLTPELIIPKADLISEMQTSRYVFQAATTAKWFALVDVSNTEEVTPHGPFGIGQEYGAVTNTISSFDWSSIEASPAMSKENVKRLIDGRIDNLIDDAEETDQEYDSLFVEDDE